MAKRSRQADDFDSPWKEALPHFLAFFFPDIHADIDWSRPYESLDKEFQQIIRRAKVGKRLADKLFKVWLKDGKERWLLIHIEIQGEKDEKLPERMFDYNTGTWRVYHHEVISLAILCDDDPNWKPEKFSFGAWNCETGLTFRVKKLLKYARDLTALEASDNPFAAVVLAHLQALETRRDPGRRRERKFELVKVLFRKQWAKEDVRQLFRLIDWIMDLPEDLEEAFRIEVHDLEEENMRFMTGFERLEFRDGKREGMEEGLEKGFLAGIALTLEAKFGRPGRQLLRQVRALGDMKELRQFGRILKNAKTIEQVRDYLDRKGE